MEHPGQAGGLQGCHGGSCDTLAVNVLGTGSGWQQNKQNWAPLAVVGQCSRVDCRHLCRGEAPPLHLLPGAGSKRPHSPPPPPFCFAPPPPISPDRHGLSRTPARLGEPCAVLSSLGVREGSLLEHSLHQAEFWHGRARAFTGQARLSCGQECRVPRARALNEHFIRLHVLRRNCGPYL